MFGKPNLAAGVTPPEMWVYMAMGQNPSCPVNTQKAF